MPKMIVACLATLIFLPCTLIGCSGNLAQSERLNRVDNHWGTSLEYIKLRQTLNPEAGMHKTPVEDFDGGAADIVVDKNRKTFEEEADTEERVSKGVGDVGN